MLTAFALTVAYLVTNLVLMVWLERERAIGREVSGRIVGLAAVLRYGPPLAGVVYLVTIAGDWAFVLFVLAFFATGAWLMSGLLEHTDHGPEGRGKTGGDRR